jgi:RNA polymerase sigma-70 factor (ECF subfamily)
VNEIEADSSDRRGGERRRALRRREERPLGEQAERRRVRNPDGRRVDDRRGVVIEFPGGHPPPGDERRLAVAASLRLVVRYQLGDPDAFRTLYEQHFDGVYRYLMTALRDRHEAEDAAQEVFVRALVALPRYEFRGLPFEAWLFRIVRNYALNARRRARPVTPASPIDMERWRERRDLRESSAADAPWGSDATLLFLIERLPMPQRQVLVLRYMVGLNWDEIAEVLERSSGAVRQLEQRALRFLRTRLGGMAEGNASDRTKPLPMRAIGPACPVTSGRRRALLPTAA